MDMSVYRYARYVGKNLIVCFGPWNGNSFELFNRTWIGVQENQLVAIEVFFHEEGNFIVGIVLWSLVLTGLVSYSSGEFFIYFHECCLRD